MIKAGIVGGTGYVAGELIRCLVHHPQVELDFIYSHSQPGVKVAEVHQDLFTYGDLAFTDQLNPEVDVVFLCMGHGQSSAFLKENSFSATTKIIDLGNDFRLKEQAAYGDDAFVYGLVEMNRDKIKTAQYIANPGCFATAIQLAVLPLATKGLLQDDLHVNAVTGSTGAGSSSSETAHFSWRNNNLSVYKPFTHQHLGEITESVQALQAGYDKDINFVPVRGNFTRGIFANMYTATDLSEAELLDIYQGYYADAPFTQVANDTIHLKQVVNTNHCLLQVQKVKGKVLVTSVIDNLLKGAAGQAIQNMNLLFGLEETTGLNFKANYF